MLATGPLGKSPKVRSMFYQQGDLSAPPLHMWSTRTRNVKGRWELLSLKQSHLPLLPSWAVSDADWTTGQCHPTGCVPSTLLHRQRSKAREAVELTQSWCEMMEPGRKARRMAPAPPTTPPSGRDSGPVIDQTCHFIFLRASVCSFANECVLCRI